MESCITQCLQHEWNFLITVEMKRSLPGSFFHDGNHYATRNPIQIINIERKVDSKIYRQMDWCTWRLWYIYHRVKRSALYHCIWSIGCLFYGDTDECDPRCFCSPGHACRPILARHPTNFTHANRLAFHFTRTLYHPTQAFASPLYEHQNIKDAIGIYIRRPYS